MLGLQCLPALEFCVLQVDVELLVIEGVKPGEHAGSEDSGTNSDDEDYILDTALPSRESQVTTFCTMAFGRLPSLMYLVIMGGSVMYAMSRGGRPVLKPLLDQDYLWFPNIYAL